MDLYPTLLDLAGIAPIPSQHADGKSLSTLLADQDTISRDTLYWHFPHYHGSTWTPGAAIRHGDFKLIELYENGEVELYDLADDVGERHDLADAKPDKRDELLRMLHDWQREVGARMAQPNPEFERER